MTTKKLTTMALLTAFALIIFIIELQIPPLVPIAGVKLGLANIITLFAIFVLNRKETLCILLVRIILGSVLSGRMVAMMYSLCGGLLCFVAISVLKIFLRDEKHMWIYGVIGAIFHNIGQIIAALIITKTIYIVSYLPILIISGIITGIFTGFATQFLLKQFKKIQNK